jgi:hypothetical protein
VTERFARGDIDTLTYRYIRRKTFKREIAIANHEKESVDGGYR